MNRSILLNYYLIFFIFRYELKLFMNSQGFKTPSLSKTFESIVWWWWDPRFDVLTLFQPQIQCFWLLDLSHNNCRSFIIKYLPVSGLLNWTKCFSWKKRFEIQTLLKLQFLNIFSFTKLQYFCLKWECVERLQCRSLLCQVQHVLNDLVFGWEADNIGGQDSLLTRCYDWILWRWESVEWEWVPWQHSASVFINDVYWESEPEQCVSLMRVLPVRLHKPWPQLGSLEDVDCVEVPQPHVVVWQQRIQREQIKTKQE